MLVIPAINESSFEEVKNKIELAAEFSAWVHIDVADGKFTPSVTWNNPEELLGLGEKLSETKLEIHLMVVEPQAIVEDWLRTGVERVIVHEETLEDNWSMICSKVDAYGADLMLAIAPETPVEKLVPYLESVSLIQFLAVSPGPAGQALNNVVLEKMRFLKGKAPHIEIEIDGGINLETAKMVKNAGADIVVSASYIWKSTDPKETFGKLTKI